MAILTEYIDDYKLIDPNSKLELEKNIAQSIERAVCLL